MHEGFNNNYVDGPQEGPFDYLAEEQRLREEREAIAAAEKAEKDAKEKKKREERLAKQLAKSAAKREELAKKNEDLKESTKEVQAQVVEAKKEIVGTQSAAAETTVEMRASNGSEYVAGLADGEGATLVFDHGTQELSAAAKQAEQAVELAEEVSDQAAAIARARDALRELDSEDISTERVKTIESDPIYNLGSDQFQLRDRLRDSWGEHEEPATENVASNTTTYQESSYGGYPIESGSVEKAPDKVSPLTTTFKSGASFVGGLITGRQKRSRTLARELRKTTSSLASEASSIKREVESIQRQSFAQEYMIPKPMEAPIDTPQKAELATSRKYEAQGSTAPAIPAWITQIEKDVKNGRVAELKKWQLDILRVQHPELLKKYEKLDSTLKEKLKQGSKEVLPKQNNVAQGSRVAPKPGELPVPVAIPAYMAPTRPTVTPSYEYGLVASGASDTLLSANNYAMIVLVGGVTFGAVLIAIFGF